MKKINNYLVKFFPFFKHIYKQYPFFLILERCLSHIVFNCNVFHVQALRFQNFRHQDHYFLMY